MAVSNDILRATLKGNIALADAVNMVFHYIVTTGTELDYVVIATAIGTHLNSAFTGIEGQISDRIQMNQVEVAEWDFTADEFDGKASVVTTTLLGADATPADIDGAAMVIRFITEELRRQARKFVPGLTEADITNNALDSGLVASGLVTAGILNDDFVAGGVTLRACTFNSTPLSPRFETASKFIPTAFVNALVGYQRRRQPGAGA